MREFFKSLAAAVLSATLLIAPGVAQAQSIATSFGGNFLINPWMEISQLMEGNAITVTSTAAGTYTYGGGGSAAAFTLGTIDGWGMTDATSAASNTLLAQNAAIAPNGSSADLLFTVGTGSATHADGTLITLEQRIEPVRMGPLQYGTANAQSSFLSFCAKASIAGNYSFYILGGASAVTSAIHTVGSSYFHQFNIPTAAQWSCYQFQIPGDTGGTWLATTNTTDTTHGATLGFVMGLNGVTTDKYGVPTATAADGVWQNGAQNVVGVNTTNVAMDKTTGATFELTGVKWALDANPLTHNPELELLQAQRYFNKTTSAGVGGTTGVAPRQSVLAGALQQWSSVATGSSLGFLYVFPVQMRATPTCVTYNPGAANASARDITAAGDVAITVDANSVINNREVPIVATGSLTAVAHVIAIQVSCDARL